MASMQERSFAGHAKGSLLLGSAHHLPFAQEMHIVLVLGTVTLLEENRLLASLLDLT